MTVALTLRATKGSMLTHGEVDANWSAIAAAIAACQPLDSDLSAIAALSTTPFGRALLTMADAAAGRTTLGLGTAATSASTAFDAAGAAAAAQAASQPLDADLTAIAALATTSYGRSLLTLADAAAAAVTFAAAGFQMGGNTDFNGWTAINLGMLGFFPVTVSQLPPAAGADGRHAYVTDAATTLALGIGTVVTGGGANRVPVYCDGTNWRYG